MLRSRLAFGTAAVVLVGISVYSITLSHVRSKRPVLEIANPAALQLGQMPLQEAAAHTVRIVNTGQRLADVAELKASCGCTSISPAAFQLRPGQAAEVELAFDLQSITGGDEIPPRRPFDVTLVAMTKPPHRNVFQWPLTGQITSVFKRVPQRVELHGTTPRSVPLVGQFTVECHESLEELQVATDDEGVVARVQEENDGRLFHVELSAAAPNYGERELSLRLTAVRAGVRLSAMEATVVVRRAPDVLPTPAMLNLGVVAAEEPAPAVALQLVSASKTSFVTRKFTLQADARNVGGSPSAPINVVPVGNGTEFSVRPAATRPGFYKGVLAFDVQQGDEVYEVEVPYIYYAEKGGAAGESDGNDFVGHRVNDPPATARRNP